MLGLIGKKIGMTQIYDENDVLVPITVVEVGPCPIVQIKDEDADGYTAVKIGFGQTSPKRLGRPGNGVYEKAGVEAHRVLREFRVEDTSDFSVGSVLDAGMFVPGDSVAVTGQSKGKGFQGGVKRHHFKGGPKTHGQSDRHRAPGSIGQSSSPSRVFKGMKMAGHMGDRKVTVKGIRVVQVDQERNLVMLKGAVPGSRGGTLVVCKQAS
ncbi:MAG: 50S ribosomal protein L3 [Gemmatimonadetes bacterium]|nr:50S ribosomal protein L3 [Gemmatimonadota bacterium]